ncbi:hypothetical protein ACHWQZ_G018841 [Mnemiopsis leidyi]
MDTLLVLLVVVKVGVGLTFQDESLFKLNLDKRQSGAGTNSIKTKFYESSKEDGLIRIKKQKKRYPFGKILERYDEIEIRGKYIDKQTLHNLKVYIKDGPSTLLYILVKTNKNLVILNSKKRKESWNERKAHELQFLLTHEITNKEVFTIKIICLDNAFSVAINGVTLNQPYPYRIPLDRALDIVVNVDEIPVKHFKWISLKMPLVSLKMPEQCPPGMFSRGPGKKCLKLTEAMEVLSNSMEFGEKSYRYKIVGNDTWRFFDSYGKVVLSAQGPIDWTTANVSLDDLILPDIVQRDYFPETGETEDRAEVGLPGDTGLPGETGRKGRAGKKGSPGKNDWCGVDYCRKGERGEGGIRGETGAPGEPGVSGEPGYQGERGGVGERGTRGEEGETGSPGEAGRKGEPGLPGIPGIKTCGETTPCSRRLGNKCYGVSMSEMSVKCKPGYAAASVWENTRFWSLRCCEVLEFEML